MDCAIEGTSAVTAECDHDECFSFYSCTMTRQKSTTVRYNVDDRQGALRGCEFKGEPSVTDEDQVSNFLGQMAQTLFLCSHEMVFET